MAPTMATAHADEDVFLYGDVRKKKFTSLFPSKQSVSIVLGETSAAYCLKVRFYLRCMAYSPL
jgi:hypothetical protein